jgi:hypothetical protein
VIFMPRDRERNERELRPIVNLSRLEALGSTIFGFALTLLALDLRLPAVQPGQLTQGILALLPIDR